MAGEFTTANQFYRSVFGKKVYKISLNGGCTCPTRDGTKGLGGCIFCSETGSGDFATTDIASAKEIVSKKLKSQKDNKAYIAYFQNFTNTYGNLDRLKKNWETALNDKEVVGLALGTRPDCISSECLQVLGNIAEEKHFLQVELGLQTVNPVTAEYIRRCYDNSVYKSAVERLHKASHNIHVVTHIIFGLPTGEPGIMESEEDMMNTVKAAIDAGTDGIKITNLYILKNTDLYREFEKGLIKVLTMEEYFRLIRKALEIIPESVIIHRLTGDPPKSLIIEPKWCTNKKMMLNLVNKLL